MQTSKMRTRVHMSSPVSYVSNLHCHMGTSSTSGCAFVYFTVQYCIKYLYLKPKRSGSKHKSSSDVAGTALYFSMYGTIKYKMFCLLSCIIWVKSIIKLL